MLDYHVHAVAHGEYRYTMEWISQFLHRARQKGLKEIGFSEHDEFSALIDYELIEKMRRESSIQIRMGLEIDYIPGRESIIKEITAGYNYDYLIGSVHFIGTWGFDHPDFKQDFDYRDIDEIYRDYFSLVKDAVETGLFDVVGHIDLIKVWGHRPKENNILYYVEPVLKSVKEAGMVIEINSSGLRKTVAEIYPSQDILQMMHEMDIPITLGSDAHHPTQLGEGLINAVKMARDTGFTQVVRFEGREKKYIPLCL
jgi:histidinol-phosphatase (PHP family)